MQFKKGDQVIYDRPGSRYHLYRGNVVSTAKDGSWATIQARTGLGDMMESKRRSGDELAHWRPHRSDDVPRG